VTKADLKSRPSYQSSIEWVPVSEMDVDPRLQRPYEEHWAKKIAANYDPNLLGKPLVWMKNGKGGRRAIVLDGNHRRWATVMARGNDSLMECETVHGITDQQAAELFVGRNTTRAPRALDRFRVSVTAGDPECIAINRTVEDCGITVGQSASQRTVSAVQSLRRLYRMDDSGKILRQVLTLAIGAWGDTPTALNGDILVGLGLVLHRHAHEMDLESFERRLAALSGGSAGLIGKARGVRDFYKGSMAHAVARVLVATYDTSRRNKLGEWMMGRKTNKNKGTKD